MSTNGMMQKLKDCVNQVRKVRRNLTMRQMVVVTALVVTLFPPGLWAAEKLPTYLQKEKQITLGIVMHQAATDDVLDLLEEYHFTHFLRWGFSEDSGPGLLDKLLRRQSPLVADFEMTVKIKPGQYPPRLPNEKEIELVKRCRDYTNLRYHIMDEVDFKGKWDVIEEALRILREADGHKHKFWAAMMLYPWSTGKPEVIKRLDTLFDEVYYDAYCIPGGKLKRAGETVDLLRDNLTRSPVGVIAQAQVRWHPEARPPLPVEIRIMVYYALAHGVDNIYYYRLSGSRNVGVLSIVEKEGGKRTYIPSDRMNEIGILNAEIEIAKHFIGSKNFVRVFQVKEAELEIGEFKSGEEKFLVVVRTQEKRYFPGKTQAVIELKVPGRGYQAYSISFPRVKQLATQEKAGNLQIRLNAIDSTDMVLVTKNPAVVEWVRQRMRKYLPSVVKFALRKMEFTLGLVSSPLEQLRSIKKHDFTPQLKMFERIKDLVQKTQKLYSDGQYEEAYAQAHTAEVMLRNIFQDIFDVTDDYNRKLINLWEQTRKDTSADLRVTAQLYRMVPLVLHPLPKKPYMRDAYEGSRYGKNGMYVTRTSVVKTYGEPALLRELYHANFESKIRSLRKMAEERKPALPVKVVSHSKNLRGVKSIIDGDLTTGTSVAHRRFNVNYWVLLDLGKPYRIDRIGVMAGSPAPAKQYIWVSTDIDIEHKGSLVVGPVDASVGWNEYSFKPVIARYVKYQARTRWLNIAWFRSNLNEIAVYEAETQEGE